MDLQLPVSRLGATWCLAKPWRKRLLRRLWPELTEGLDLLEVWIKERGPL